MIVSKNNTLFLLMVFFTGWSSVSQYNELSALSPSEIGQQVKTRTKVEAVGYIPYPFVDERDILWKKTVWEIIDLKQKANLPFYFPTINNGYLSNDRISLFRVLIDAIEDGSISEVYRTSHFRDKLSKEEINQNLYLRKLSEEGIIKMNAGELVVDDDYDVYEIQSDKILQYWIKGTWYFSKRLGALRYQLIGIAAVAPDVTTLDEPSNQGIDVSDDSLVPLFWIWYKDVRQVLAKHKVYTGQNTAQLYSYDDFLVGRKFQSVIYGEENIYDDRLIRDYVTESSMEQLFEAERIKETILNFELDIWRNN